MKIKTAERLYLKEVEARKKRVRGLKKQGYTWAAIGKLLGITQQRAQQIGKVK